MTATLTAPPLMFTPASDPAPVELAVALSIASGFPRETYLWIERHRADGGMRLWHAWTEGGDDLGDQVDGHALAADLDAADWLEITGRHEQVSSRGRTIIRAYPLRPVLATIQAGLRCPEDRREGLRRVIRKACELNGRPVRTDTPPWLGVGPLLTARKH